MNSRRNRVLQMEMGTENDPTSRPTSREGQQRHRFRYDVNSMTQTESNPVHFFSDTFAELEPAERMQLLDHATKRHFEAGESIIRQGTDNRNIYIVADGVVRVELEPDELDTPPVLVAHLDLGSIFGEMTFLTHAGASANVVAEDSVQLFCLDHGHLHGMITQDPGFGCRFYHALAVTLADRLRQTSRRSGP